LTNNWVPSGNSGMQYERTASELLAAHASTTSTFCDTAVGSIAVERRRPERARATILLWPSIFSDRHLYDRLIPLLGTEYDLILVDPPGQGRSGAPRASLSLEATARATLEIMDQLGVSCVRWVGTSWGGLIGVYASQLAPSRVSHLSCLNTPFDLPDKPAVSTRMIVWGASWVGTTKLFADGVARSFFKPETLASDPAFARRHLDVFRRGHRASLHRIAKHVLLQRENVSPKLSGIRTPTLVVAGREDLYPVAQMQAAASLIPGSRFRVVENSRHISVADAPNEVHSLLLESWDMGDESVAQKEKTA
jgi:3-oxoadipate enol-lactonase